MKRVKTLSSLREGGVIVCMGNFDGVHCGHQKLLKQAQEYKEEDSVLVLFTFDPHPQVYFKKDDFFLIDETRGDIKNKWAEKYGFDVIHSYPFNSETEKLSASQFLNYIFESKNWIKKRLCVGENFSCGYKREGDQAFLKRFCKAHHIVLDICRMDKDSKGEVISSSRVRAMLKKGNCVEVTSLLGRYYSVRGCVQRGEERGRKLGYRTANMVFEKGLPLPHGVYAGYASCRGKVYDVVMNWGQCPTFSKKEETLEVHFLHQNMDLYDQEMTIFFIDFVRKERCFATEKGLKEQIRKDCQKSRYILNKERKREADCSI